MKAILLCLALIVLVGPVAGQPSGNFNDKADSIRVKIKAVGGIGKARQWFELARLYAPRSIDSSRRYFEEALAICREDDNDTTAISLITQFSPVLSYAGHRDVARHYVVSARDLTSRDANIPAYRQKIYLAMYNLHYWFWTDYDSCHYYIRKYLDVATDSNTFAYGYIELGATYNELGDNVKSLDAYQQADAYLQSPKADTWTLHHLNNNLGMLYYDERELKKSEQYFLKALEYARRSGKPGAEQPELNNLGVLYDAMGEYDKSVEYLTRSGELMHIKNDPWVIANNHLNIGTSLSHAGRQDEAIEKFKYAMELFRNIHEQYKIASIHRLLAEAYRKLGRYRDAEREALLCLEWDRQEGYGELVKESYRELYLIYGATRQFDKAFDYQSKYLTIVDSLNSADRKTRFGLVEKNLEIARQERLRETLERENELHLAKAEADRAVLIAVVAVAIVLAVTVLLAFLAYRRIRLQKVKIEEQAAQLQEAARLKTRFFANVSHELRTPLTLLSGMLELIHENPSDTAIGGKMKIALESSKRLQGMLNEVLDLTRLEAGKWELNLKRRELLPLLNRIVFAFESLVVKKNLELRYDASQLAGVWIDIDEDKFEKIVNNLIYNAIKFNRDGGFVQIRGETSETMFHLHVVDSGPGIPEKDLPYIFDRFYQSASTDRVNAQGIGIGLSLVKEFTQLHSGDITVTSRINEGSHFTLTLPLNAVGVAAPETEEAPVADVSFDVFQQRPVVLVVEDNEEMRYYLREILGTHVSIHEAGHGRQALNLLKTHKADLIISDVMMPEMDGYELLAQLKSKDSFKRIPVIMLTARAAEEDLLHGLALGVDDYIIKPFNARELRFRVHNLLTNQKMRTEWMQRLPEADEASAADTEDRELLKKVTAFIEKNIGNPALSIADLGDHLAMSERQVYRKIGTLSGMTPAQLIKEIRLKIAYRLLAERKVSKVSALATSVGFDASSYFSRVFEERYGKRPSEFL